MTETLVVLLLVMDPLIVGDVVAVFDALIDTEPDTDVETVKLRRELTDAVLVDVIVVVDDPEEVADLDTLMLLEVVGLPELVRLEA